MNKWHCYPSVIAIPHQTSKEYKHLTPLHCFCWPPLSRHNELLLPAHACSRSCCVAATHTGIAAQLATGPAKQLQLIAEDASRRACRPPQGRPRHNPPSHGRNLTAGTAQLSLAARCALDSCNHSTHRCSLNEWQSKFLCTWARTTLSMIYFLNAKMTLSRG